jgi:signal transduction histidine kinase
MFCQQKQADSLNALLGKVTNEKKVDVLNEVADYYFNIDTKTANNYGYEALKLAESLNYPKGIAASCITIAFSSINVNNKLAIQYALRALALHQKYNNQTGIATANNILGVIYYFEGDYYNSINYHLNALKLREEIGKEDKIAVSYNNIALVHMALGNYETALDYLQKGLVIRKKNNDKRRIAIVLDNIGDLYSKIGEYGKAFDCMRQALVIHKELGNVQLIANCYSNMAATYRRMNDNENALKYYNISLNIFSEHRNVNGISSVENGIAAVYQALGNSEQAIVHALSALTNARTIPSLVYISMAANVLQQEYSKRGDYNSAYKYLTEYVSAKDSLISVDKMKKLNKKEFEYRVEQLKKEQEEKIERQNIFIYALSITLFLIIIIFILINYSYKQKKQSNEKLSNLNLQLNDLNSTKDKFFSIIAHDLKSPFLGLMGYSQILSEEYSELKEDERKTYIGYIYDLTKSSYSLLENLLEWARLQTGKIDYTPADHNMYDVLNSTIEMLKTTALNKRISIDSFITNEFAVHADKYMLQAIVRNLISNSIKFTQPNGRIEVRAARENGCIILSVKDDGVGMTRETIDSLFKIDKSTSTKGTMNEEGTGLGLILCKEMVEMNNGRIWAESEGQGSTFSFSLPMVKS